MSTVQMQDYRFPQASSEQLLVLIIEDDPSHSALFIELLSRRDDLKLLATAHGGAGVKLARAHLPAVILMDINLPGLNGNDALGFLRNDPNTANIPVIAVSSELLPSSKKRMNASGFFGFLPKPFPFDELRAMVDAALRHSQQSKLAHA